MKAIPNVINQTLKSKNIHCCIVEGEAGWGKSHTVWQIIKNKPNVSVLNTHATPLGLYTFLFNHCNDVIVLDDCYNILRNPVGVSLLKAATFSPDNKRLVRWVSTSQALEVPDMFEFGGKVIILANGLPDNPEIASLWDRSYALKIHYSFEGKAHLLATICQREATRQEKPYLLEVGEFLLKNITPATHFSVRTLIKAFDLRENYVNWQERLLLELKTDELLEYVYLLSKSNTSCKMQFKECTSQFGISRSTFFAIRRRLGLSSRNEKSESPTVSNAPDTH